MRSLKVFSDGSRLEYGRGMFDDWCVYLIRPDGKRFVPKDIQYFTFLRRMAEAHGARTVYEGFVVVYDKMTSDVDDSVFEMITCLSQKYGEDALEMEVNLSVVYACNGRGGEQSGGCAEEEGETVVFAPNADRKPTPGVSVGVQQRKAMEVARPGMQDERILGKPTWVKRLWYGYRTQRCFLV